MTNTTNTVLYTGVTSDLVNRCIQHRNKIYSNSFSAKYNINKLVYYEEFGNINNAIVREKQIKGGSRKAKLELIKKENPNWLDLFETKLATDYL